MKVDLSRDSGYKRRGDLRHDHDMSSDSAADSNSDLQQSVISQTVHTNDSHRDGPRQARYWLATIPEDDWTPALAEKCVWAKGQLECGESGYRHWQVVFAFATKVSLATLKRLLPRRGVIFTNKAL